MENKVDMDTVERLVKAIKERSRDGKLTIVEVYAAVRDVLFMQSSGREDKEKV